MRGYKYSRLLSILFVIALLISACATTTTNSRAVFRKEPYLVYTNANTSMTVMWQADSTPGTAKIEWGPTASYGNQAAVTETNSGTDGHQFSYTITGLVPAARTYYRVTVDDVISSGSFMTAPSASSTVLSFYAYGDNRDGPAEHNTLLGRLMTDVSASAESRQTFCLHGGDLVYDGEDEPQWDLYFFNPAYLNTLSFLGSMPVMPALGNHEIYHADFSVPAHPGDIVRKYWPFSYYAKADRSYYSFDYGPAHVCVLDQYNDDKTYTEEASAQFQWVEADLSASTKPWKFVLFHEPAWTASTATGYHGNNTDIQDHLCPVFKNNGVKVVMQGHAHYYARVNPPDGLTYLTLGGGGAALGPPDTAASYLTDSDKAFHFARFDINGDSMNVTIIDDSGNTIDSFTVNR